MHDFLADAEMLSGGMRDLEKSYYWQAVRMMSMANMVQKAANAHCVYLTWEMPVNDRMSLFTRKPS